MKKYDAELEQQMRNFFETLSEKDKRHYAAIEARKVGMVGNYTWKEYWAVQPEQFNEDKPN